MTKQPTTSKPSALSRLFSTKFIAGTLPLFLSLLSIQPSNAGSATWNLNPISDNWNTAANWTPATVPNGPNDTATFDASDTTTVSISANTQVDGITFNPGASAFTITANPVYYALTLSGAGIRNNSGITQNFTTGVDGNADNGNILFTNSATAGALTVFRNAGAVASYGPGGSTSFFNNSSAGSSKFINDGGHSYVGYGGVTSFNDSSSAGSAILISAVGDLTYGGSIYFSSDSTGGTARVEVYGNGSGLTWSYGNLDISNHNAPGVAVGSLEGSGTVYLGANNLTVGNNGRDTTFSGAIQDGNPRGVGSGGSLTKVGTGSLDLSYVHITYVLPYSGGTTVENGELLVDNRSGSGTGTGPVQVNAGVIGGRGIIAGALTVGNGNGAGAVLAPGRRGGKRGTLTIQGMLTLNSDTTYNCGLKTKLATVDKVVANGVTISGARYSLVASGHSAIAPGTAFTVIDNTAATPIAGTFSNLADGSTLVVGGNTFQVSYEGGDGNDLTLTVQ